MFDTDGFQMDDNTGAEWSCSFMLNGRMMIVGGDSMGRHSDQLSVVESCSLHRVGTLPMEFELGGCNTFQAPSGQEEALLCFGLDGMEDCHR